MAARTLTIVNHYASFPLIGLVVSHLPTRARVSGTTPATPKLHLPQEYRDEEWQAVLAKRNGVGLEAIFGDGGSNG